MKSVFTYFIAVVGVVALLSSCKKTELEDLNLKGVDAHQKQITAEEESADLTNGQVPAGLNHSAASGSNVSGTGADDGTFGVDGGDDGNAGSGDVGSNDSGVVGGDENEGDDDDEEVGAGLVKGGGSAGEDPYPKGGK